MTIAKELGYKRYFNIQEILLKVIGVDFKKKSVKHPYLLVVPTLVLAVLMFSYAWKNRQDSVQVTESAGPAIQMVINAFKLFFFVLHQKKIHQLLQNIWKMSKAGNDAEEHAIIKDVNSKAYYISNSFIFIAILGITASVLSKHIKMAIIYWKMGVVHIIPLNADIPFDYSQPWKFALIEINYNFFLCIGAVGTIAIDSLYIWLIFNVVAQFRILNMRLRRAASLQTENELERAVIECIRFHQRIIELAEDFDLVYRPMNFVQFAMSCLPICTCAYKLTMTTDNKSAFMVYLISLTFQTALYCVLGQLIQDESYSVTDNIYQVFSWERLSKTSKQLLLITMPRAQKRCAMTGIFFVIDISLFVWVFKTTSSYITILWTLTE